MSNSISVSMHCGSGTNAVKNLSDIKRIDLHNNRKYKNNKNEEIDLSLSQYNVTIVGSKNITEDIKEFYKKEFTEATYNYNKNQKDERRKIADYLTKMDKDSKSNIAVEFIFQVGDREDWQDKSLEDKKKTTEIFKKAISILEEKGIKTVNASLHLDETSPHLHLLAVPIIENQKRGLEKQVSQNKVITLKVLNQIRTEVEKAFIEEYNKIYGTNKTLKKGCEISEHLQVKDYKDTKKVLEVAKKVKDKVFLKEAIEQDYKKIADEVKEKEKENNFLTNQLTKLEREKTEKKQDLEKIKEDIEKIDNIREELNNQSKDIEKLKADKDSNNSIIEMYQNNVAKTNEKIDNLKKEFNKLEDERTEEVKKIEEVKKQIEEQNRIRIAQNNILRELEETEKIKEERKKKLKELEEQNQELLEKIKNAESNIISNTNQLTELEEKEKEILKEVEVKTETVNQKDKISEVNKMFKYIRNADEYDIYTHFKDFEMFQFLSGGEFKETFIYFLENIKEKNTININVNDEMLKEIKKMNTKYNATLDEEDKKEIVEQLNKVDNKTTKNDEELEKNEDDFELNL